MGSTTTKFQQKSINRNGLRYFRQLSIISYNRVSSISDPSERNIRYNEQIFDCDSLSPSNPLFSKNVWQFLYLSFYPNKVFQFKQIENEL